MKNKFINYYKNNKKFCDIYILLLFLGMAIIIFSYNNYFLYSNSIAKITDIKEYQEDILEFDDGLKEYYNNQKITAVLKNGVDKGKMITLENHYYSGLTLEQKYQVNDDIFVSLTKQNDKIIGSTIDGYKRDKYIVILIVICILSVILVGHIKGFFAIISVILNIIIFNLFVVINSRGISLIILSLIAAILFSVICLTLVSGFNSKTYSAIISTIISLLITFAISLVVIKYTDYGGLRFDLMELLTRPYEEVFICELILGGLGAIMDISISISSSLNELIEKNNKITYKQLIKSGRNIGSDIMGTMINVLFFTFISGSLTNLVIFYRNNVGLNMLMKEYISLEMSRALVGAIGIVIAIQVSIYITMLFYKRRLK